MVYLVDISLMGKERQLITGAPASRNPRNKCVLLYIIYTYIIIYIYLFIYLSIYLFIYYVFSLTNPICHWKIPWFPLVSRSFSHGFPLTNLDPPSPPWVFETETSAGPRCLPGRQGHFLRTGSGLGLEESLRSGDRLFKMIKWRIKMIPYLYPIGYPLVI